MPYAAVLTGYGSPETLVWSQVALPAPGPGQIRMRVHAAGVGLTYLKIRRGDLREVFRCPTPPFSASKPPAPSTPSDRA